MPDFHPFGGRLSKTFGSSSNPEDAYLSYYDIRLTKEDISVLKNDWLTDNVISFWEEYLEREFLSHYTSSKIVLLRPAMAFMVMQTPDPKQLIDALPDFKAVSHIFLPINDNRNVDQPEGGTHWSLLLVSLVDGVAFHYDSLSASNHDDAFHATRKLAHLFNRQLNFIELRDSPQQENGSDCGVFVCLNMRHLLLKRLLMVRTNEKVSMSMGDRRIDAREGRKEMLRIIENFRKEGERRRSVSQSRSPHPHRTSRSPPRIDSPVHTSPALTVRSE